MDCRRYRDYDGVPYRQEDDNYRDGAPIRVPPAHGAGYPGSGCALPAAMLLAGRAWPLSLDPPLRP